MATFIRSESVEPHPSPFRKAGASRKRGRSDEGRRTRPRRIEVTDWKRDRRPRSTTTTREVVKLQKTILSLNEKQKKFLFLFWGESWFWRFHRTKSVEERALSLAGDCEWMQYCDCEDERIFWVIYLWFDFWLILKLREKGQTSQIKLILNIDFIFSK
jgi:hypothetical protein